MGAEGKGKNVAQRMLVKFGVPTAVAFVTTVVLIVIVLVSIDTAWIFDSDLINFCGGESCDSAGIILKNGDCWTCMPHSIYGQNHDTTVINSANIMNIDYYNIFNIVELNPNIPTFANVYDLYAMSVTATVRGNLVTPGQRMYIEGGLPAPADIRNHIASSDYTVTVSTDGGNIVCYSFENQIQVGGAFTGCNYDAPPPYCRIYMDIIIPGNWTAGILMMCRIGSTSVASNVVG